MIFTYTHEQRRFPLATLIIVSDQRAKAQRIRLLALAYKVARQRLQDHGIPTLT